MFHVSSFKIIAKVQCLYIVDIFNFNGMLCNFQNDFDFSYFV